METNKVDDFLKASSSNLENILPRNTHFLTDEAYLKWMFGNTNVTELTPEAILSLVDIEVTFDDAS